MVNPAAQIPPTATRPSVDRASGALVGSSCRSCGITSWPARAVCQRCGAETEMGYRLPREGSLMSFTTVWVSRPGLEAPYSLGQVIVDGSTFFGHVRGLPEGAKVPLPVDIQVGSDDADVLFWFEPSHQT